MTTFDLRSIRGRSGEEFRGEQQVELGVFVFAGQEYVPVPEHAPALLSVTEATSGTVFELRFAARLHGPCFRCLADAVVDRELHVREYQANAPGAVDELRTPYLADGKLDLTAWARDSLVLSLPDQILCRPDCAGLCPVCGRDRNREPHTHEEVRLDPRWAALEALKERL